MGKVATKASQSISSLLRAKRAAAGLTLRGLSDRLAQDGERIPTSTLARIEQGALDPGIRRLHRLLRVFEVPPHLAADLIELEELAVPVPETGDPRALYQRGVEHWKKGDLAQGLAHLFAIRHRTPADETERAVGQKTILTIAVAARNLGKFKLARELVQDLLCQRLETPLLVSALILGSSIWRGLGSKEMALALIRQAEAHLEPGEDQQRAWVLHQQAKLLLEAQDLDAAARALDRSLKLYRGIQDSYGEGRALTLRAELLDAQGRSEAAFRCVHEVLELSARHDHRRLAAYARLELGRLWIRAGSLERGIAELRIALGEAVSLGDANAEFLAHYRLWKAHAALGDRDRATFELQAAKYFVQGLDESMPEADEVREISQH